MEGRRDGGTERGREKGGRGGHWELVHSGHLVPSSSSCDLARALRLQNHLRVPNAEGLHSDATASCAVVSASTREALPQPK
eukprot:1518911-Rhodomonas_salina.2